MGGAQRAASGAVEVVDEGVGEGEERKEGRDFRLEI
jgi:hypothetical protein